MIAHENHAACFQGLEIKNAPVQRGSIKGVAFRYPLCNGGSLASKNAPAYLDGGRISSMMLLAGVRPWV